MPKSNLAQDHKQDLKLTAGASITESYRFFTTHITHFFRLIYGPLFFWVLLKLITQILIHERGIQIKSIYFQHIITAGFAIAWYRQFLLGERYTSYYQLLKMGFNGNKFSWQRFKQTLFRIIAISLALLIPTLLLSISMLLYYFGQGIPLSEGLINELAIKSTFVIMLIFSPILVRLSLYTAAFALGRSSMSFKEVWQRTRGYTVTLWWVAIRGFLPLSLYSYVVTYLLNMLAHRIAIPYVFSTILIETLAGFLTFMMLAIVVGANAEAFRILIGVRESDGSRLPRESRLT